MRRDRGLYARRAKETTRDRPVCDYRAFVQRSWNGGRGANRLRCLEGVLEGGGATA